MPIKRELIYIDNKDETDRIARYYEQGDKLVVVFNGSSKEFAYSKNRAQIIKTGISNKNAFDVFNYLKNVADTAGIIGNESQNTLAKSYEGITTVPKECVLSDFLNGSLSKKRTNNTQNVIFPFGFNLSQLKAVDSAFNNNLSVIEGPPGTGKTQTILNIIANAVMNGQSVAVVSSNNSAVKNVYEKLEKAGLEFMAAVLGSNENKQAFIESQKALPDLSTVKLSSEEKEKLRLKTEELVTALAENLDKKNRLAQHRLEIENTKTEYRHFKDSYKSEIIKEVGLRRNLKAHSVLRFWLSIEKLVEKQKSIGFIKKLIYRTKYGVKDSSFYVNSYDEMILSLQLKYYPAKISELEKSIASLEASLEHFSFDTKMKEYTDATMKLFKASLYENFFNKKRETYSLPDLYYRSNQFITDYPVIMSTTYSLKRCLDKEILYDYVIIDEASQVDLATGALALSCAKRAVIVGDIKQLPNVVTDDLKFRTDVIFSTYKLKEAYRYSSNSLLSALLELFPEIPKTLLREHYRCHPKIIEFCNQKFYDNQLITLSEYTNNRQPLMVYKTTAGNHARQLINQRQIDVIRDEIIEKEQLTDTDLGIVTPYRNQTNALQHAFRGSTVKADTVDKFQGRENEVIILSTVDNEISEFTDNPNRLNVAVSRAQEQLILVVNGNESGNDGNIADLIQYIEYNNFSVIESEVNSVFDLLYKGYEKQRAKSIKKSGKVSEYDSENLMYGLIKEVLNTEPYLKYDVLMHFPIRNLIRDFSKLTEPEIKYAKNPLTHLDFIIYNKLGKVPVLGIEVDGFEFHKEGSTQSKRDRMKDEILNKYHFPILRFGTNESNEKGKLVGMLEEIQKVTKTI
ncbi:Superfamily I DNA and/or RNA helicase [Paenimyroides ummariense]|uniref:Superfamily I DNA and/or RNA helicase n=1 Tax=Paenimyroides ummariense TaxID=913024 RepID=A0A1I5CUG1_9FLAO|nr:AAA domain-containing protein [Paenimyroides ummariense]SFN90610.1 Superfamily I DNA and/or RNA helicase [Paenimyroides ummariense]